MGGLTLFASVTVLAPTLYIVFSQLSSRHIYVASAFVEGTTFPALNDLLVGYISSLAVVCIRLVLTPSFETFGRCVLSEKNVKLEDRVQRFAAVSLKTIFYMLMTVTGFCLLMNEPWFPLEMGGNGNPALTIIGWPNHQMSNRLRLYFLIQIAYKAHEVLYLVATGLKRNDWFEMAIHHGCTLCLISLAWGFNWIRLAALVLFVHDAGDIFTYAIKVVVDTSYKIMTGVMFVLVVASWAWTRLYVLPAVIIRTIVTVGPEYVGGSAYAFASLLGMLLALHCYWFLLILSMGWKAVNTGQPEDTYQRHDD